jgi:ASCH domain-containing protein
LKAISIRQPHASMIASGVKSIEYRTWSTKHRGDLLVVAASYVPKLRQHRNLPRGCALAIVKLIDVVQVEPRLHAWILSEPRLFPSIPVKGKQKLWTV